MFDFDSTMDYLPVLWNLNKTLMTLLVKLMLKYHSLQPRVIHPPQVKNVGYSWQLLLLFRNWFLLIDSIKATALRKMSNVLHIIF